jgi:hypothetical protein
MGVMRGITIKLPEAEWQRLRQQARASGRSVAALVRERVAADRAPSTDRSVHGVASDLAGAVAGGRRSATNRRQRFRRP